MEPIGLDVHSDALHGEKVGVGTLLTISEYQRLCGCSNIHFKNYEEYNADFLVSIFGEEMSEEILSENENDVATGITAELLKNNWEKISVEVNNLPKIKWLESLYFDLDVKSKLTDIGVDENMTKVLLDCSPTVRNRLTLMRLRKCF